MSPEHPPKRCPQNPGRLRREPERTSTEAVGVARAGARPVSAQGHALRGARRGVRRKTAGKSRAGPAVGDALPTAHLPQWRALTSPQPLSLTTHRHTAPDAQAAPTLNACFPAWQGDAAAGISMAQSRSHPGIQASAERAREAQAIGKTAPRRRTRTIGRSGFRWPGCRSPTLADRAAPCRVFLTVRRPAGNCAFGCTPDFGSGVRFVVASGLPGSGAFRCAGRRAGE